MRALMFAVLLAAGCTSTPGPSTMSVATRSEVAQVIPEGAPLCPSEWTCDSVNFFSTQSECVGACGGQPCFLEQDCSAVRFCMCR